MRATRGIVLLILTTGLVLLLTVVGHLFLGPEPTHGNTDTFREPPVGPVGSDGSGVGTIRISSSSSTSRSSSDNGERQPPLVRSQTAPPLLPTTNDVSDSQGTTQTTAANADPCGGSTTYAMQSFRPLGTFRFWGRQMNTSDTCPTAGLNNQLSMLLGLLYCHYQRNVCAGTSLKQLCSTQPYHQPSLRDLLLGDGSSRRRATLAAVAPMKFKDIFCTPTGGKEGVKNNKFRVGSTDYEYAWSRWSEIFDFSSPSTSVSSLSFSPPRTVTPQVCLRDEFSWSEHSWFRGCATSMDHFYGSGLYWHLRSAFRPRPWYTTFAEMFFCTIRHQRLSHPDSAGQSSEGTSGASLPAECTASARSRQGLAQQQVERTLAIHVRRGDYAHFCSQTAKTSGVTKFRIPAFIWTHRLAPWEPSEKHLNLTSVKQLSQKFKHSCAPTNALIFQHIESIVAETRQRKNLTIDTLLVVSNSETFLQDTRARFASSTSIRVVSLRDWTRQQPSSTADGPDAKKTLLQAALSASGWRSRDRADKRSSPRKDEVITLSPTEASVIDMTLLSLPHFLVLNRYSTFSQTAVDMHAVREETLASLHLFWW